MLKFQTSRLAAKWQQPYYLTYIYVESTVAITLVQVIHWCIHTPRVPMIQISTNLTQ